MVRTCYVGKEAQGLGYEPLGRVFLLFLFRVLVTHWYAGLQLLRLILSCLLPFLTSGFSLCCKLTYIMIDPQNTIPSKACLSEAKFLGSRSRGLRVYLLLELRERAL